MTIAFETKHYVFGTYASTMTVGQLIEAVKKIEKEIENLESVKTKSKTIDNKKAELKAMLKDVVNILDAR